MAESETFGSWLRRRRRFLGLTQSELAGCAACSPITVRKMESDERRPSRQLAELLADCLQIPTDERERFVSFARQQETAAPLPPPAGKGMDPPPVPGLTERMPSRPAPVAVSYAYESARGVGRGSSLPSSLTPFIGREPALDHLLRTLREGQARPMTLVGAGGSGKTRLALEVASEAAAELGDLLPDGVWWVDLASLDDGLRLAATVARALGLLETPDQSDEDILTTYLATRRAVIVLDNCEHLIDASARLVERLLRRCPEVQILATSREALKVSGETLFPVPTLSLPEAGAGLETVRSSEAVRLFVERVAAQRPGFQLSVDNVADVVQICRRLDGIPLALELAAARVKVLSLAQIAARLDDRFALLTGGARTALPRQQTLRALVDWSHDLLEPAERVLFRRLATFAGGWTLPAAEEVAGDGREVTAAQVLDLLARLVDKSLIKVNEIDGEMRYEMLDTIRAYAVERLVASGEAAAVRARHLAYFVAWTEEAALQIRGADQAIWLDRLEREHDNLRLALRRALVDDGGMEPLLGAQLAGALGQFWLRRNYPREGAAWTARALERLPEDGPPAVAASLLSTAGTMAWLCSRLDEASAYHWRALEKFRAAGDEGWAALSLRNVAVQEQWLGRTEQAMTMMVQSVNLARRSGDRWAYGNCLLNLGLARSAGDHEMTRSTLEESVDILREVGDGWPLAIGLCSLGMLVAQADEYELGQAYLADALQIVSELGDVRLEGLAWQSWGKVQRARGEPTAASFRRSVALLARTADVLNVIESMEELAIDLSRSDDEATLAARLLGTADRWREQNGVPAPKDVVAPLAAARAALRAALGEIGYEAAHARGRGLSPEEAVTAAL